METPHGHADMGGSRWEGLVSAYNYVLGMLADNYDSGCGPSKHINFLSFMHIKWRVTKPNEILYRSAFVQSNDCA